MLQGFRTSRLTSQEIEEHQRAVLDQARAEERRWLISAV
jgi:hypothetical protein